MAAVTICSDFEAPQNKVSHCFHCFPIYLPWSDGTWCHALNIQLKSTFWMLSFKPTFSLSSFTFIKSLFDSSSLSAIRVVTSAYLRLLIFFLAILIPACASSSSAFHMMYSAYMLNKQGDNIQLWHTPFPIWNQSVVSCPGSRIEHTLYLFGGSLDPGVLSFLFWKIFTSLCIWFVLFVLIAACWIYSPDQGLNPGPLHWERGAPAPGPPGKSWMLVS